MLIKLIIYLGLKKERQFIEAIAKLEYGVAIFCRKLSSQATNHPHLAQLLESHAQEEIKHGKMLSSLIGKIQLNEATGRWLELTADGEVITPDKKPITQDDICSIPTVTPMGGQKLMEWDSIKYPGKKMQGIFENLDGLSQRYFSLKILFGNKKAEEFDWADKLAFMCVLEEGTGEFYQEVANICNGTPLGAIASQITKDEEHHAEYLKSSLRHFSPCPHQELDKWRFKVNLAKWAVIIDLCTLMLN